VSRNLPLMRIARDDRPTGRQPYDFMTNWDTIVASDGPMVWRTLCRLLVNRADVEECFQETFLAALKLSERETVKSWPAVLCSLAVARAMDRLRKRYRRGDAGPRGDDGAAQRGMAEATSTDAGPVEHAVASLTVYIRS
jgi:DNA-directed RNA polymerase specialized sigma24 family protein